MLYFIAEPYFFKKAALPFEQVQSGSPKEKFIARATAPISALFYGDEFVGLATGPNYLFPLWQNALGPICHHNGEGLLLQSPYCQAGLTEPFTLAQLSRGISVIATYGGQTAPFVDCTVTFSPFQAEGELENGMAVVSSYQATREAFRKALAGQDFSIFGAN